MLRFSQRIPSQAQPFDHLPHFEYGEEETAARFLHENSVRYSLVRDGDRLGIVHLIGHPSTLIWGSEIIAEANRYLDEEYDDSMLGQDRIAQKVQEARGLEWVDEFGEQTFGPLRTGDYLIKEEATLFAVFCFTGIRDNFATLESDGTFESLDEATDYVKYIFRIHASDMMEEDENFLFEDLEETRVFLTSLPNNEISEIELDFQQIWHGLHD